jgi:thiol-disulfide isomerase/thioredoxin
MALTYTPKGEFGSLVPNFKLLAVDGKTYTQDSFKNGKPTVFMFICNHCPYVKAIEDRLIQLGRDLQAQGISVVGICSNDAKSYPDDSFEKLKERSELKNYTFTYLYDETQEVAREFGAVCTPDFFVYDGLGRLAYRGRLDDSWKDASLVTKRELYEATLKLAANDKLTTEQTPSMGCSIKWLKE